MTAMSASTNSAALRIGVVGLGRAFTLMLPTFLRDERVQLVAACDLNDAACAQFVADFGGTVHRDAATLCADPAVELVYVASPHQWHAAHVQMAAAGRKHVLLEKPMAIALGDCDAMIGAMHRAGRALIVGHSHSFDAPVLHARALIDRGEIGAVQMIQAFNYTDFLYRPRRPEELDTAQGGGVVHSQAAHQVDVVRLLGGGLLQSVRAITGQWDVSRPTEGAYSALLSFQGGAFANLTYSGYGHFDSDDWMDGRSEIGLVKSPADYGAARRRLGTFSRAGDEVAAKAARNFGGAGWGSPARAATRGAAGEPECSHQHFGPIIVSGERGALRLTPHGVWRYGNQHCEFDAIAVPMVPRREVIDELWRVLREGAAPQHDGPWARATTEACLAILESSCTGTDVLMRQQVAWRR